MNNAATTNAPTVHFEQVVSRGCGLDVHEKNVVATVDGEGLVKATKTFDSYTSSLNELREWLLEQGVTEVATFDWRLLV